MKFLTLILHSGNRKDRYYSIVNTWGNKIDLFFYSDYDNGLPNVIKVSDKTDYFSCPEKQINILKMLPEAFLDYDWYFFCDDDTFLNFKLLQESLPKFDENYVHGEIINCYQEDPTLLYPQGGAGFLISNKIFKILREKAKIYDVLWSDVCLGLNLKQFDIPVLNHHRFHSQPPACYPVPFNKIHKHITFHHINNEQEQSMLNNICHLPQILWGDDKKDFDLVNF